MGKPVFIIVPCYNEESVIAEVLRPLTALPYAVVAVDDGSCDRTASVIRDLPVKLLRHPFNLGQGAALQTGMEYALENGAAIIVHFDGDGQHTSEAIADLIRPILAGEADAVLGSRFLRKEDSMSVPPFRRLVLQFAVRINNLLTGLPLSDAHNGLRAFSRKAAKQITMKENRYAHATEILGLIKKSGVTWKEVPVSIRYTKYSLKKGQTVLNALNIMFDLLIRRYIT